MNNAGQQYLNDLDKRLWSDADRPRANVNPGDYMHVVLGLVFLKYVSDAFKERRDEREDAFHDPANDYYLGDESGNVDAEMIEQELEARDYYTEKNVFGVPALARLTTTLRDQFAESARLEAAIRKNLAGLGYER